MYKNLFGDQLQREMEAFFVEKLAPLGIHHSYDKNEIVDPEDADFIYIVLEGAFNQVLYANTGGELTLFRLARGTIFGEMDYFEQARTCVITKAIKKSSVSAVPRKILTEKLNEQPELYHHFMHSMIRKFRIVMLELADVKFNDALGKLAHALVRWHYITNYRRQQKDNDSVTLDLTFTHEELATRLASNRSTITSGLNFFKEAGYLKIEGKTIIITSIEGLKRYITDYWHDE